MIKFDIYNERLEFYEGTKTDLPLIIYGYFVDEDEESFDAFYINRNIPNAEKLAKDIVDALNSDQMKLADLIPIYK